MGAFCLHFYVAGQPHRHSRNFVSDRALDAKLRFLVPPCPKLRFLAPPCSKLRFLAPPCPKLRFWAPPCSKLRFWAPPPCSKLRFLAPPCPSYVVFDASRAKLRFFWRLCQVTFFGVFLFPSKFLPNPSQILLKSLPNPFRFYSVPSWEVAPRASTRWSPQNSPAPFAKLRFHCRIFPWCKMRKRGKDEFSVTLPLAPNPSELPPFHLFSV